MNEIALLQRTHEVTPEPGEDALAAARGRLEARIAVEEQGSSSTVVRGLRPRTVALVSLAAASAAAVAVVASVGVGQPEPATAGGLLRFAAGHAITASDAVASPGQYVRIETHAAYVDWYSDASGIGAYVGPELTDLYIPADRSDTWVRSVTEIKPTRFFGPRGKTAAEKDWASGAGSTPVVTRAKGGHFVSAPELGGGTAAVDDVATMPRDPQALLRYLKNTLTKGDLSGDPSEYEQYEFDHVASLLESGSVPADLRAALYRTLALMPGVKITDHETVLDGRSGTAFGLGIYQGKSRQELVIDPDTGEFIGERSILTADYGGVPAGTTVEFTAVRTSIVNAAP